MVWEAQCNHYLGLGHDHGDPRGDSRGDPRGDPRGDLYVPDDPAKYSLLRAP